MHRGIFHCKAIFEKEANRTYHVYCPALKGCHIQGDTYEESLRNIRKAAAVYIESLLDDHQPIPEEDVRNVSFPTRSGIQDYSSRVIASKAKQSQFVYPTKQCQLPRV